MRPPLLPPTSLAPALTLIFAAVVIAHVVHLAAPRDSPVVFVTVSNGAYLAAGLLCPRDDGALALLLVGAASLAYHSETSPHEETHTLDISLGWVLVVHLAFATSLAVARAFAKRWRIHVESPWRLVGRIAAYAVLATAFTLMFALYDAIKRSNAVGGGNGQLILYFIAGPVVALAFAVGRGFFLTRGCAQVAAPKGAFTLHPYAEAAVEALALLALLAAAVVAQGDLLGRELKRGVDTEEYDLFHGYWHAQIAALGAVVYQRVDDLTRYARAEDEAIAVCRSRLPALLLFDVLIGLAVLVVVLKEARAGAVASEATLGVASLLACGASAFAWWSARRDAARAVHVAGVEAAASASAAWAASAASAASATSARVAYAPLTARAAGARRAFPLASEIRFDLVRDSYLIRT